MRAPSNATFTVVATGLDVIVNPDGSKPNSGVCTISGYNWDFGDGGIDVEFEYPGDSHVHIARDLRDHIGRDQPGR